MSKQDYYKILGLDKSASEEDIKKAYRKLASTHHPDKFQLEQEKEINSKKFKEIKEAYEYLTDPKKVDNDYVHSYSNDTWDMYDRCGSESDMYHIYEEILKNTPKYSKKKSQPIPIITISLQDAYVGRKIHIDSKTSIDIPKGIRSNTRLFANGNLYQIEVTLDKKFKRSLDDLMTDVNITAIEAMLGIDAVLNNLDGNKLQFSIPAGIQNGQIIKLSKKGMKNPELDEYGDMLIQVSVTIPKSLSESEKTLLKGCLHRTSVSL